MPTSLILTNVAIVLLAASQWEAIKGSSQVTPSRKTYLIIAAIFALISTILQVIPRS